MEIKLPPLPPAPPAPPKYSPEQRAEYLRHWRQSGLNGKEYAKLAGINYGTFKHWMSPKRKKLPTMVATAEATQDTPPHPPLPPLPPSPNFVSLRVEENLHPSTPPGKAVIEIHYANGSKLNIYQVVPVDYLRELLK